MRLQLFQVAMRSPIDLVVRLRCAVVSLLIERISVVWEESGSWEALQQGIGTLAAASATYGVMQIPAIEHLLFVFPELLLIVLALTVLMGRYTGYRLSEMWRFRGLLFRENQAND